MVKNIALFLLLLVCLHTVRAQQKPYKDPSLPIESRVKDLLSRMTPEEKFWQLFMIPGDLDGAVKDQYRNGIFGFQVSAATKGGGGAGQLLQYNTQDNAYTLARKINAIQRYFVDSTRLGIPMLAFDEALHGLVRKGATAFPQAIGLAASFDTAMMGRVARAIAREAAVRGIRDILTPVINIAADPRWGRTEETYGEDPLLSSLMGLAFVRAFEQRNIITTPKHFVVNSGDGGRDSYPIHFNQRILDEIYFPPFKTAIQTGGSRSVMTAYNSLDGSPCTANAWLLLDKLKKEWGFKGFVISDASAVGGANVLHFTAKDYADAGKQAITNGLDVIFQTEYEHYKLFIGPFLDGEIPQERIDDAVSRVLRAKFELGLFENPYVSEKDAENSLTDTSHRSVAEDAALRSFVLLKNDRRTLPFKGVKHILVVGEDATEARLGGYSGTGNDKVSILDGIRKRAGSGIIVSYAKGVPRSPVLYKPVPAAYLAYKGKKGLQGQYYPNPVFGGDPVLTRQDETVNFAWTLFSPDKNLAADNYSIRWTGRLKAPATGKYRIGLEGNDGYRLYIDNVLWIDRWSKQSFHTDLKTWSFEKDRTYDIRIEFYESQSNAHIRLVWDVGVQNTEPQDIDEALRLAAKADAIICTAGIEEGEFRDRAMLSLPGRQEALIHALAKTGKPLTVLLVGGSAITMQHWIAEAGAVLNVWYPGETGGTAVAKTLFGDYNPGGRLPLTYPLDEAQLPLVYNHKPTGRGDDYNNLSGQPLFPFGFGLSYTSFAYSDLRLDKTKIAAGERITASFTLTNTGACAGDEVVQLYIRDMLASVARPVLELKSFQRVRLNAGEHRQLSFDITPDMMTMLDAQGRSLIEPGDFRVMIGSSSRDCWLKDNFTVVATK